MMDYDRPLYFEAGDHLEHDPEKWNPVFRKIMLH